MKGKIEIKYRGHFFADEGNIRGRERERHRLLVVIFFSTRMRKEEASKTIE